MKCIVFPYIGFASSRTKLLPHQLYIANEVSKRHNPRVLLADEVGLGKTIEAGLIIAQLLLTERVHRVLVIVPESLVSQWFIEMLRRFNISFSIFDQERFQQEEQLNAFEGKQLILSHLDFCSSAPFDGYILEADWDLLVVDEAHHIQFPCDTSDEITKRQYNLVKQLSDKIPNVVFLTATPEQMGLESHFQRLHLLDSARFSDFDAFLQENEQV